MANQDDLDQVRAELNVGLEAIEPLVDHHTRLMGEMSGRLQVSLDFLTDVETVEGWASQPEGVRDSVHYARLLVAAVLRLANGSNSTLTMQSNDGFVSMDNISLN
ncbi:MAG: hypothetical protein HC853_01490 [Anaerolineae bacterium]|nr:hypothetical protein [Anaerolineae bacterium]